MENAETGDKIDLPAVSVYRMHNAKVIDSRMFHFDTAALVQFLNNNDPRQVAQPCPTVNHVMTNLVLAALFLPLSHFLLSSTRLRSVLVDRLGESAFSRSYSVLTLAAFAWLIIAYMHAPALILWLTPQWLYVALLPIILVASVLAIAGLTTPNPVIVRSERLFDQPGIVRGVLRVTRNAFFWGASLFSLAHVIILGDVAAILAFGSIAFLGLAGASILDAKKARKHGQAWDAFAAVTSNVPFLGIRQGRQRLALREMLCASDTPNIGHNPL